MERFTIDFESYYDKEYSLRNMTPVEYILDPRYETIMLSVKRPGKKVFNLEAHQVQEFFNLLDPKETIMVSYNSLFDACIAAWRYNFVPALIIDAMGMVRAWCGHDMKSVALAAAAPHLGVGFKGHEVTKMMGFHTQDIKNAGMWDAYADYCNIDSILTEAIFHKLMALGFPTSELLVQDLVLRMAVVPQFELNEQELASHLNDVLQEKDLSLTKAMMCTGLLDKDELMSNTKFAKILESLGVDIPTKISPATRRVTYAFSKSDRDFTDLENHPSMAVQTVMAARLDHKSTIEETRTARFLSISRLQWPAAYLASRGYPPGKSLAPMPLRYGAAHTHRLGGDWKLNVQNFPSRSKVNHLKSALMAPRGHQVVNIDSSQIEARIVAWLCEEWELLEQFKLGLDPYRIFAAKVFGILPSQVTAEQRFLGKTSILGLGFGLGWIKFKHQVRVKSLEAIKYGGSGSEIILPEHESVRIVNTYRSTYAGVPRIWSKLNNTAISVLAGSGAHCRVGPCTFYKERISLPNGLSLHYHNLRSTSDGWLYDHAGEPRRLYGGALLENIVQALARIIVMDAAVRIKKRIGKYGIEPALQVHDAFTYVVPDAAVTLVGNILLEEMNREVSWAKELPLAAELKVGPTYGDCR